MNLLPYRRTVTKPHNEGARLLWAALAKRKWSQARLAREIGVKSGLVTKWLHCDRRPGLENANEMWRVLKIPTTAWHEPPTSPVAVPSSAGETPKRAAAGGAR